MQEWDGSIIIFDFEVFKYDTLLGCILIKNDTKQLIQLWDVEQIKKFFLTHQQSMWVGHNNLAYDNVIMDAIMKDKNVYNVSNKIVKDHFKPYNAIQFITYDVMGNGFFSLKSTEAMYGKTISESEVDFNLDRPLTDYEKKLTESYNKDDLDQTLINFFDKATFGEFKARIYVVKEFNLDYKYLNASESQLASIVLGAKKIPGIEYQTIQPPMYDFLELKNKDLLEFYKQGKFKQGEQLDVTICGVVHKLGDGGSHAALNKCHFPKALYCDVSGYYNLIMINLDLLPRSMPKESRDTYIKLYYEQLKLKKTDPERRMAIKKVLLAVWGSMRNEYTDFYDPEKGKLMTITGQLFIIDLLEKLEEHIILVQTNTDGVIIVPKNWEDEELVLDIVKKWTERTGFTIKPEYIYDIYQRDVNNYIYRDDKGNIHCKGEAVKHWNSDKNILGNKMFDSKEPIIIAKGIVNYFINKILPEDYVNENKHNLTWFQWLCKPNSYDYMQYEKTNVLSGETTIEKLQKVNRAFASNDNTSLGMVYKYKVDKKGVLRKTKVSSTSDNIFIYNDSIIDNKELIDKIDYNYYIERIYDRISEFMGIKLLKDIKQ